MCYRCEKQIAAGSELTKCAFDREGKFTTDNSYCETLGRLLAFVDREPQPEGTLLTNDDSHGGIVVLSTSKGFFIAVSKPEPWGKVEDAYIIAHCQRVELTLELTEKILSEVAENNPQVEWLQEN